MADRFKVGDRVRLSPEGPGTVASVIRYGKSYTRYGVDLDRTPTVDTPYEAEESELEQED